MQVEMLPTVTKKNKEQDAKLLVSNETKD